MTSHSNVSALVLSVVLYAPNLTHTDKHTRLRLELHKKRLGSLTLKIGVSDLMVKYKEVVVSEARCPRLITNSNSWFSLSEKKKKIFFIVI